MDPDASMVGPSLDWSFVVKFVVPMYQHVIMQILTKPVNII
jgi:hypothetical protein